MRSYSRVSLLYGMKEIAASLQEGGIMSISMSTIVICDFHQELFHFLKLRGADVGGKHHGLPVSL